MAKEERRQPELRFKGFTADWEQREFKEIVKRVSKTSNSNQLPKVEFQDIVAGQGRLDSNFIEIYDDRKGIVFRPGNILYGKLRPYLKNWLLVDFKGKAIGDFWVFEENNSNSRFIYYLIQTNHYQRIANDTSGTKMPRSDWNKVSNSSFFIPTTNEQELIGQLFKLIDYTLTLHQRKLKKLKTLKKAYLQQMFPEKTQNIPKLRFKSFSDEWKQRELSTMTKYKNGKGYEDIQAESGELELINLNSISLDGGLKYSGKYVAEAKDTLHKNDIVMILSDIGHGNLLGRVALIPEDNRFVLNQRVARLRPNETVNPEFLFTYINTHQSYFKSQGAGMSQLNLSKSSVENFKNYVPLLLEQQKIGTFFKHLDELTTLQKEKLTEFQKIKKSLLNNLFV
ncbi:restriction endonuclease subunit S [Ruoffia tabacinasalis]|nr:restriction endonuclease subunit S [Ruoffia tabacinasalis]